MGRLDDVEELCETLLLGCRILTHEGVVDSSGHLSFRIPNTNDFVIPARQAPGLAVRDSLIVMDEDGNLLEGEPPVPLEWPIHARVYRTRPDVGAIMHSHSPMSRVFSISTAPLRPVFGIASPWLYETVPVCALPGVVQTAQAGDQMAEILADGPAVLLRGHGNVVVGPSLEATTVRAVVLEQVARSLHQALAIGGVDYFSADEVAQWREATPGGHGKAWAYLRASALGILDRGGVQ